MNISAKKGLLPFSLLGHADPETTFMSYIHLCDWMLGRELSAPAALPAFDVDVMVKLTGLSRATVYRAQLTEGTIRLSASWDWDKLFRNFTESRFQDPLLS